MDAVDIGQDLSGLTIELNDGSVTQISEFAGRTAVLILSSNVWDPVAAELEDQYKRVADQFPEVGAKLVDLRSKRREYKLESGEGIDVPILVSSSKQSSVQQALGISPTQNALLVIDEAGRVRWSHVFSYGASADPQDLREVLQHLDSLKSRNNKGLTRRQFLAATFVSAFILTISLHRSAKADVPSEANAPTTAPTGVSILLNVNDFSKSLVVDPRVTLLDALRERLSLTGTKKGCDHGQCGACTVHIDGRRVNSCLTLAVACPGKKITTIEGLATGETLHPMQTSFIEHDGFQCGYCTSGQIMSAVALLKEPIGPADDDVREAMSGNICRCGAYPNIVDAVQEVRRQGASNASL